VKMYNGKLSSEDCVHRTSKIKYVKLSLKLRMNESCPWLYILLCSTPKKHFSASGTNFC
jgi:hypothetical protein